MGFYENRVLPQLINFACSAKPNRKQREKVVPLAEGEVLEVGFGSGLNLPFYDSQKVCRIWALEPSAGMRRKARTLVSSSDIQIDFIDLPGERIPLAENSVDTVLVTYSLCTIEDPVAALAGMRRVLKPAGSLLFCEHGIAPDAQVCQWQHRLNPAWSRVAGGCNMNRDIPALITQAGFEITLDQRMYIPGIRMLSYNYWGRANAAG